MKFVFTDKKVTLPASVHAYAEKKVGKLDRYFKSDAEAVSTIERQIRKNKARLEKRLRKDAFERSVDVAEVSDFVPEEEEEFRIERVKRFPIKPMTQEEAILQMNLVDHAFFAFKNEDAGGAFSVVYRRENGGYGLIEDAL